MKVGDQFKVGDLIKLKPNYRCADDSLAIVVSVAASALFGRIKIQYFDRVEPFMTDPLRWTVVSKNE